LKETPEDGETSPIGRINIRKMGILPKAIYRFNAIPHQNPNAILCRNRKIILKFIWKHKRPQITKLILSKKANAEVITIQKSELYYKVIVTKIACHCNQKKQ
jgi:hypothetical protein